MKRNRDLVRKYSYLLDSYVKIIGFFPQKIQLFFLKKIRKTDSYFALATRYAIIKNNAKSCGSNVAIFSDVYLYNIHNLVIGDNVSIHPLCYINASGNITIGSNVSIAHSSSIISEEHSYSNLDINIKDQGFNYKSVFIEDNVWIGSGVRILAGSIIRTGSIVGAGAVVTKEIFKNNIAGGVPAITIKIRGQL